MCCCQPRSLFLWFYQSIFYQYIHNIANSYVWKVGHEAMYYLTSISFAISFYLVETDIHHIKPLFPSQNSTNAQYALCSMLLGIGVAALNVFTCRIYGCLIENIHRRIWTLSFEVAIFLLPSLFSMLVINRGDKGGYYVSFLVLYSIENVCQLKHAILSQPDDQARTQGLLEIIGAITLELLNSCINSFGVIESRGWTPVIFQGGGFLIGFIAVLPLVEDLVREIDQECKEYAPLSQEDPEEGRGVPMPRLAIGTGSLHDQADSEGDTRRLGVSSLSSGPIPGGSVSAHSDCGQSSPDASLNNSSQEESALEIAISCCFKVVKRLMEYHIDFVDLVTSCTLYDLEASDAEKGVSGDYLSNLEHREPICVPVQTCSASLNNCFSPASGTCCLERVGISQSETSGCSTASGFSEGDGNHVLYLRDNLGFYVLEGEYGMLLGHMGSKKHLVCVKDEGNDELIASRSMICGSIEVIDKVVSRLSSYHDDGSSIPYENVKQLCKAVWPSLLSQKHLAHAKEEKDDMIIESQRNRHCQEVINRSSARSPIDDGDLNFSLNASSQHFTCALASASKKKQLSFFGKEKEVELIKPIRMASHIPKGCPESIQSSSTYGKSLDDEPVICILEDISQSACSNQSVLCGKRFGMNQPACSNVIGKRVVTSHCFLCIDTLNCIGVPQIEVGGMRSKACDEQLIFQVAPQDLSQPISEASPPDGVLAVPLLKHQCIALSWVVQKETSSTHCSGRILADDQELGETISTITFILKERSRTFRVENGSKCKLETLNSNDDDKDNGVYELDRKESDYSQVMSNRSLVKSLNYVEHAKGRAVAGVLDVCPSSVLQQWVKELQNKVASKGNLSVLAYHGSNQTKDPSELAKYDVVTMTYSIVGMEVPKQLLVDKEDDDFSPVCWSGKKRKYLPSSVKKHPKHNKAVDVIMVEIAAALAKVGWYRMVSSRTQVARACWGLSAKCRWCLSGIPIQNAKDDLYTYSRFHRYDPFAVCKSFCATIKVAMTKNPVKGYRKLQAILKTIMLHRTEDYCNVLLSSDGLLALGTLLDGEPIISLPPKVIVLKQVEFTKEKCAFYNQLEIDSHDQFKEYAAAGNLNENYVHIMLMVLHLLQGCHHPLLFKGFDSNAMSRTSVEIAKMLPWDTQICLLNCLEVCLAICGICNNLSNMPLCQSFSKAVNILFSKKFLAVLRQQGREGIGIG